MSKPRGRSPFSQAPDAFAHSLMSRRGFVRAGIGVGLGTAGLLTGCSSDGDGDKGSGSGDKPDVQVSPAPATDGVQYPPEYVGPRATQKKPFTDGSKTFTVVVPQDSTVVGDWNKNEFTAWLEKRTGMKVEFKGISLAGGDMTKVNAMLAAGDLPDAFLSVPFTRDQVSLYGQQGVFAPLDDHIDTYAIELQQAMKDYPDLKPLSTSSDGKIYRFPTLNDCAHCATWPSRAWVNKNMIDAGGGKIPTTTDEFRAFLKALKDNDATGHGDTVPLLADVSNPLDRFFMNAFLYNPGQPWLRVDQDKVDFVANKPEWREGLKFLRSLFDDGTLTKADFTRTAEESHKLGEHADYPVIAVARTGAAESFVNVYDEDPKARWREYVPIPALKGPKGVQFSGWDYYSPYGNNGLIVTSACENPELMVLWADYQMELEATMRSYDGEINKTWSWSKEGAKGTTGEQAIYRQTQWPAPPGQSWYQFGVMYRSFDFRAGVEGDPKAPSFEAILQQASDEACEPFQQPKEWQLPPLIFEESTAATNADTLATMGNHVKQSLAQFAIGELDINDDGAWKTYVDKIEQMGLPALLENYQQAFDGRPKR